MKNFIITYAWAIIAAIYVVGIAVFMLYKFLRWLPPLTRMLTMVLTAILTAFSFSLSVWAVVVLSAISFLFLLCLYFEEKKPIARAYEHEEEMSEMEVSAYTEVDNDWYERMWG